MTHMTTQNATDLKEKTMTENIPPRPPKSFRMVIELTRAEKRIDNVLLAALREQRENADLQIITRTEFKELFTSGKVLIKGQRARPSSGLARGTTYVDILGYK